MRSGSFQIQFIDSFSIIWLTTDLVMGQFFDHSVNASLRYIDLILQSESEERQSGFHHGSREDRLLGDDHFAEQSLAKAEETFQANNSLEQIIEAVCTVYKMTPSILAEPGQRRDVSEARAMTASLTLDATNLTCTGLAAIFHRDLSGLSQAARRL